MVNCFCIERDAAHGLCGVRGKEAEKMKKTIRKCIGVLLIVALLCGGGMTASAGYIEDSTVFRASCTVNGDTATQRGFCWYTKTEVKTQIRVLENGRDVTETLTLADEQCTAWEGNYMHKITVKDLKSGTEYTYQLMGDAGWSEPGSFRTDDGDDKLSFIGIADVQASSLENFMKGVRTVSAGLEMDPDADFVVNLGDFTNDSTNEEWDYYAEAFDGFNSGVTLAPIAGNHDGLGVWHWFDNLFCLDTSESVQTLNGVNYSYDYGNAHFAVLNTNDALSLSLAQLKWLYNDMRSTDKDWKIVFMHKSPYTLGKDGKWPDALYTKETLARVCELTGVDLVMSGHDHQYLRTKSLKLNRVVGDGEGVTYVLAGTAGSKRYEIRDFMLDHFITLDKLAALTVQKGGKDDTGFYHQCYLQDGSLDNVDLNRIGGVFNNITIEGGKLTYKAYVIKDREEGETEDVITEIDSFELTKEPGENKIGYTGKNTTSAFEYALLLIPSFLALAVFTFGNWFPRFLCMLPKLVYTVITKDVF